MRNNAANRFRPDIFYSSQITVLQGKSRPSFNAIHNRVAYTRSSQKYQRDNNRFNLHICSPINRRNIINLNLSPSVAQEINAKNDEI